MIKPAAVAQSGVKCCCVTELREVQDKELHVGLHISLDVPQLLLSNSLPGTPDHALGHLLLFLSLSETQYFKRAKKV